MLEVKGVYKTFNPGTINEKKALNGIDLTLNKGDFVTVIGGNGAGKSTILNMITGVYPVDCGTITIDGLTVDSQKHHHKETLALRRKTGMVFQNYNLFRNKTVLQNITEGLTTVRKIPHEQAVETAMALLKKVNLENRASA